MNDLVADSERNLEERLSKIIYLTSKKKRAKILKATLIKSQVFIKSLR